MKEFIVKLISGHGFNSKSFGRYVNLAQSYLENEMDTAFGDWAGINESSPYLFRFSFGLNPFPNGFKPNKTTMNP